MLGADAKRSRRGSASLTSADGISAYPRVVILLRAAAVANDLGLGVEYAGWLEFLEATGAPPEGVPLPRGDAAEALLRQIGLDEPDLSVILAELPLPGDQSALWW